MDSFEFNKIFGAILGTLLFVMGVGFVAEAIYHPGAQGPGYNLPEAEAEEGAGDAPAEEAGPPLGVLLASADSNAGSAGTRKCQSCHSFEQGGPNKTGPNLYEVVGRVIGSHEGFGYSDAFLAHQAAGDTWTYEELDAFLTSPKQHIPGTKMSFSGIASPEERADILAYVQTLSPTPVAFPTAETETVPNAPEGEQLTEGGQTSQPADVISTPTTAPSDNGTVGTPTTSGTAPSADPQTRAPGPSETAPAGSPNPANADAAAPQLPANQSLTPMQTPANETLAPANTTAAPAPAAPAAPAAQAPAPAPVVETPVAAPAAAAPAAAPANTTAPSFAPINTPAAPANTAGAPLNATTPTAPAAGTASPTVPATQTQSTAAPNNPQSGPVDPGMQTNSVTGAPGTVAAPTNAAAPGTAPAPANTVAPGNGFTPLTTLGAPAPAAQ